MRAMALLPFLAAVLALALPTATHADDPQGCGAEECIGSTPVVPSLDPEWSANFVPPPVPRFRTATACIPTDVIFYAQQTDWLRAAQKMRANMSPCASYYVSIPPIVADKTKPRGPLQAGLIRALGPNFHAMNDINVDAWTSWVAADPGRTWYGAGVEARHRMDDPAVGGFDPAAGDIWALNELKPTVRQGSGLSRQNMRDFVHGLYDGDGGPPMKGLVWVSGISQGTTFLDTYRGNVKNWLGDASFWLDMSQYVTFFSQEVYGRVDRWGVPGTTPQDRLTPTADYLEHFGNLAAAGAYVLGDTSLYFALADGPTGNAAWPTPGYEWPVPPVDYTVAAGYAAAQVYAFRHDQSGRDGDQVFGFAWNPVNLSAPNAPIPDFVNKTASILDRIAAAIHASDAPSADPGLAACGTDLSWCSGDVAGAAFNTTWLIFHDWTQPTAQASTEVVQENVARQLPLSATDPDPGQQLTFSLVTQPLHGTVATDGTASATYTPNADYAGPDSFTFRAYDGWMNSNVATVTLKVNAPPVVDAGADVTTQWGVPVTLSGTATDPDGDSNALVASWDFGDGSTGTTLQATHAYAEPGTYTAQLTVTDADQGVASDTTTVTVGPRTSSLAVKTNPTLDVATATVAAQLRDVVDAPSARLQGHDLTFAAGGTTCTAATNAAGDASCTLPAAALALGPSTVTVQFGGDTLYSASSATGQVVVYGTPSGGLFVVGDRSATGTVTFWSPSWWLLNTLSGGPAPPSFKGFATGAPGGWIASPGYDLSPADVPEWMAALVANLVEKDGSSISLSTSRMVVVHVDAYDPRLIGRGTVVATIG
jgi:PKD repeat protein